MDEKNHKKAKRTVTYLTEPAEDVTYNKLREEEEFFHRSEERYRALAKATAQITWVMSPDGQVIEDIPLWRAYTGQSEAGVKGWQWLEAVHPDDHMHVLAAWQNAIETRAMYDTEYRTRRADGIYRYFLVRGVPIFEEDGTLREWVGICTDITERKQLEKQLMARASQLEAIFETIADGLIVYDQKGNIIHTNLAARHLLNRNFNYYNRDLHERLRVYETRDGQGQLLPIKQLPLMRVLRGEELTGNNTVDIQSNLLDGSATQINISGAPMRDNEGHIVGAVCVFRDVTERRRLEAEHVNVLATLQETNAHLEQVNRMQVDFISIVSHEFRTTLTGIQGFSELLRDSDLDDLDVREYATDINTDALRLNRMITELLDMERMKSGKMMFHLEPLNLNALLVEIIEHTRPNAPEHSIQYTLEEFLPEVMGDSDKLTQVLTNLLSNAIKYSPNGGDILFKSQKEGNSVHISIQDSGIGIPEYALKKVFLPYNRVNSEETRYIQGTGLGLPIVHQIIQMHNGTVGVESTLGQGSTFHFTLPL
ncbi:MAG: PAS domain S-box protein [Ktedonobacteraceae bacterium]|nr:PAS domain S-box protein [Ktedonobacteraceae bacterium]